MPRQRRFCTVSGCDGSRHGSGYCRRHYQRFRQHGDPLGGQPDRNQLLPWLEAHAGHSGDECLIWPFGSRGTGYGCVKYGGRRTSASRAMCFLAHGEPPFVGADAAHSCGNGHGGCVNPKHLRWASRKENVADAVEQGTASRGEGHSDAIKRAFSIHSRADRRAAKALGCDVTELKREGEAA